MSKKMKIIPSIFKNKQAKHPWQWPSCKPSPPRNPSPTTTTRVEPREPSSSNSEEEEEEPAPPLEAVISGVRLSERLFFEPEETSSIVRQDSKEPSSRRLVFEDSVAMAMESEDPYMDFKKSMEEMVESKNLLKDWDCLEELLLWYLRMNGKINHGFIVGAFVDLLVGFAAAADSKKKMKTAASTVVSSSDSMSTTTYYSSASSSFSSLSSPLSPNHL